MKRFQALLVGFLLIFQTIFGLKECIMPGITYEHIQQQIKGPVSIHIVYIDPKKVTIKLQRAAGKGMEREEPSSIAKRVGAIVACNGANYRRGGRFNGNPLNLLKIDDVIFSDPQFCRGVLAWDDNGKAIIDRLKLYWHLKIGQKEFQVDRLNQPKIPNEKVLYNDAFHTHTLSDKDAVEIIIKNNKVEQIRMEGNSEIPTNGWVYSLDKTEAVEIQVGMPVTISYRYESTVNSTIWENMNFILGGAGIILKDSEVRTNFDEEFTNGYQIMHSHDEAAADFHNDQERDWLVNKCHPRTAIGLTDDDQWVLVLVDGRNPELSIGMTLPELGEFMKSLGCKDALNLGGGGCSALYVKDRIVNAPSGAENQFGKFQERPVSEAFVFFPR